MNAEEQLQQIMEKGGHICRLVLHYNDDDTFRTWNDVHVRERKTHPTAPPGYPEQYHATGVSQKGDVRDFIFYAKEVLRIDRSCGCNVAREVIA